MAEPVSPGEIAIKHFAMVEDLEPLVYIVSAITVAVLLYSLWEAYKRWTYGGERIEWGPPGKFLGNLVKYALLQWKVLRHRFPGTIHLLIYGGMLWLAIATTLRAIDLHVARILTGETWMVYKLLSNIAGVMVVVGSTIAMIRRALGLTPNLPRDPVYYLVHLSFITIVVTGFLLDGLSAAYYRASYERAWFDPVGYLVFKWASGKTLGEIEAIYRPLWVLHFLLAQFTLATIPYTNLWHIVAASANVALARRDPPAAAIRAFPDIDERIEEEKPIGIVRLSDTTWKQRMDYEACTSCMRCTNACPAFQSGKLLSPRDVIVTMREKMLRGEWDSRVWEEPGDEEDKGRVYLNPETVWSCVTCGACVAECPVLIHHVETILDVRRGMMSTGSEAVPEQALNALYSLQQTGNPFGYNPADREDWIQELAQRLGQDIIADPDEEYDYIYWIGCVASYDPRIRPVAEHTLRLLKRAGYKVAVLLEEGCCGEPARRMGEEALFVEIMKMNLENLSQYKFKKLLVHCPHGFHVFKNEYKKYIDYLRRDEETKPLADFLEKLEVEHHSVVLARLVREGKIKASERLQATVTFHDPCYLGRWNGVFEEPRQVLRSIRGLRIREMPRNRDRSFCCGGGGGHMFYEIKRGKRIARIRAEEAAQTLAKDGGNGRRIVAVACPYCNTMFRGEAEDFGFEVKDIAELLGEAVGEEEREA